MNAQQRLWRLAERVDALLTDWGDGDMREERDAIAQELYSESAALAAPKEAGGDAMVLVPRRALEVAIKRLRLGVEGPMTADELEDYLAEPSLANPPGDQRQEGEVTTADDEMFRNEMRWLQTAASPPPEAAAAELLRDLIDYAEGGKVAEPQWVPRMRALLAALAAPTGPQPAGGGVDAMRWRWNVERAVERWRLDILGATEALIEIESGEFS